MKLIEKIYYIKKIAEYENENSQTNLSLLGDLVGSTYGIVKGMELGEHLSDQSALKKFIVDAKLNANYNNELLKNISNPKEINSVIENIYRDIKKYGPEHTKNFGKPAMEFLESMKNKSLGKKMGLGLAGGIVLGELGNYLGQSLNNFIYK